MINSMAKAIVQGAKSLSGSFQPGIIGGFDCYLTAVFEKYYEEYIGQAIDYYGNEKFPLIQCICPTG